MNEIAIMQRIRIEAAQRGAILWRNNSGALLDARGRPVRFGLGNDSAASNADFKSSDLIGIMPVLIRPDHVGHVLGVFTAIEVKTPGYTKDKRYYAQLNFIQTIQRNGGIAQFCTDPKELLL